MSWTSCRRTTSSPDTTRISGGGLVMLSFCAQDVPRWPPTLEKIMKGLSAAIGEFGRLVVDQLLNRVPGVGCSGGPCATCTKPLSDAARTSGVGHLVYASGLGADVVNEADSAHTDRGCRPRSARCRRHTGLRRTGWLVRLERS